MHDWAQTLTILGGVGAMWFGCFTVLREDIRGIKEDMRGMENRHREDIQVIREDIKEMENRHIERMDKNDLHWRELFTYMNNKIDEVRKPS